jgi:hypothetical protein
MQIRKSQQTRDRWQKESDWAGQDRVGTEFYVLFCSQIALQQWERLDESF